MKKQKTSEPVFTCTPEQKHAALLFVERTIEAQQIIGPASCASGYDDILAQVNAEFHNSLNELLRHQGRLIGDSDYDGPRTTVVLRDENSGFLLTAAAIMDNGFDLSKQARHRDFLFAISGKDAIAYEVKRAGKSRFELKIFWGAAYDDGSEGDISWDWQRIETHLGPAYTSVFVCPLCNKDVTELYVSYDATPFGCVRCHTILDAKESKTYQRILAALSGRKRGVA